VQRLNIVATLFSFAFRMQRVAPLLLLLPAAVLLLFFRIAVFLAGPFGSERRRIGGQGLAVWP
jgi:hypothetical protein